MRRLLLDEGFRADGRSKTEVRPIRSRAGLLPGTHGSALFTRGETQAIAVATLGEHRLAPPRSAQEACPTTAACAGQHCEHS